MTVRRGRRPKPAKLRLVDGTFRPGRHDTVGATEHVNECSLPSEFPAPAKPASLKGEAARAWAKYIAPAGWLDVTREPSAIAFCELWAEFRSHPSAFPVAKHSQLRAYMGELGLTDERNRPVVSGATPDELFL